MIALPHSLVGASDALPRPSRRRPEVSAALLDEAYRLAVCLVCDEDEAAGLCVRALRGLGVRRAGLESPIVRWSLLRRVLGEARRSRMTPRPPARRARLLAFQSLPDAEREVLALSLACDLPITEVAEVMRLPVASAREARRAAQRAVMALTRAGLAAGNR